MTWTIQKLRKEWIRYFTHKDHLYIESASLLPAQDPTLLFTSAGMVPFKDFLAGDEIPPKDRACSIQKCIRTTDLEMVGLTKRHLTLFEMLGNFSFGDYFKHQAIQFAWEFSCQQLKFDSQKIHISVYKDDQEAYDIWHQEIGIAKQRIHRLGAKDNWWGPAGVSGPCGPCSELYLDRGDQFCQDCNCTDKSKCAPGGEGDRFIEFWNLVFIQYYENTKKERSLLKSPGIDTGAGAERLLMILNNKNTVYETEEFKRIILQLEKHCASMKRSFPKFGQKNYSDIAYIIIADHIRSICFAIADGILPGNTGRSYIIRRLIRRALLYGQQRLHLEQTFLHHLSPSVCEIYADCYPQLANPHLTKIIKEEEKRFLLTLKYGFKKWQAISQSSTKTFSGESAFLLYDTYGFPLEITQELAAQKGLQVDTKKFRHCLEKQKQRSLEMNQFSMKAYQLNDLQAKETRFVGYNQNSCSAQILAIFDVEHQQSLKQISSSEITASKQQKFYILIVDQTCFYARGGGQNGDRGYFFTDNNQPCFQVIDTIKQGNIILHLGSPLLPLACKDKLSRIEIDVDRRKALTRNHSATHLLNHQLRNILGTHITQAGSEIVSDHFRFDFTHDTALSTILLDKIEQAINNCLTKNANASVITKVMNIEQAKKLGALATFGEKYGNQVRVVIMGESGQHSMELCGGTHVDKLGDVGALFIVNEQSIGAGVRRITAVAGQSLVTQKIHQLRSKFIETEIVAFNQQLAKLKNASEKERQTIVDVFDNTEFKNYFDIANWQLNTKKLANHLNTDSLQIIDFRQQIRTWQIQLQNLRKQIKQIEQNQLHKVFDQALKELSKHSGEKVGETLLYCKKVDALPVPYLLRYSDAIRQQYSPAVIILGSKNIQNQKSNHLSLLLILADPKIAKTNKLNLRNLIAPITSIMKGNGGGNEHRIQISSQDEQALQKAMDLAHEQIKKTLKTSSNKKLE